VAIYGGAFYHEEHEGTKVRKKKLTINNEEIKHTG
jgi:hypothetical protein